MARASKHINNEATHKQLFAKFERTGGMDAIGMRTTRNKAHLFVGDSQFGETDAEDGEEWDEDDPDGEDMSGAENSKGFRSTRKSKKHSKGFNHTGKSNGPQGNTFRTLT